LVMYKRKGKFLQRMKEQGWEVGNLGVPARTEKITVPKPSFAKRHKRKLPHLSCPECNAAIPRTVKLISIHFLKSHQRRLTGPEAFRIASARRITLPRTVPDETPKRDPREISAGLPTLGKRR